MTSGLKSSNSSLSLPGVYSFTFFDHLPNHPALINFIDEKITITNEDLSNSNRLQKIINKVIVFLLSYFKNRVGGRGRQRVRQSHSPSHASSLRFWGLHAMTIKLNILKSILVHQLCIPQLFQILGMGSVEESRQSWRNWLSHSATSSSSSSTSSAPSSSSRSGVVFGSLVERAKAIITETFSLFLFEEEEGSDAHAPARQHCLDDERDEEITRRKANIFFHLLEYRSSPSFALTLLSPQIVTVREDGKHLLELLTCYTLSISAACDALRQSIKNVISSLLDVLTDADNRYPVSTSPDDPDHSSSIIIQYRRYIFPIIFDYLQWCRQHSESLMKDSRKDEIVSSVSASLRASLRSEQYNTPHDILLFYHQRYRDRLTNVQLPLQPYTLTDVEQAKKDIRREKILLNRTLHTPEVEVKSAVSSEQRSAWLAMREEVKKVVVFLFAIDSPDILDTSSVDLCCKTADVAPTTTPPRIQPPRGSSEDKTDVASPPSFPALEEEVVEVEGDIEVVGEVELEVVRDDLEYEEYDSFQDSSIQSLRSVQNYNWHLIEAINRHHHSTSATTTSNTTSNPTQSSEVVVPSNTSMTSQTSRSSSNHSVTSSDDASHLLAKQLQKWSNQTQRSRTSSSATVPPASAVYGDLLELLHCHVVLAASRTIAAGDAFIILNDLYGGDGLVFCPSLTPRSPQTHCDISISVTTSVIKVVLRERYRLLASHLLDRCSAMDEVVPLMCFECTTTTLLLLTSEGQGEVSPYDKAAKLLNVLITDPDRVCKRAVTIEPYLPSQS
eukprot:gene11145-12144_t